MSVAIFHRRFFPYSILFVLFFGLSVWFYLEYVKHDEFYLELSDLSCDTVKSMANRTKWCMLQYADQDAADGWGWLLRAMVGCSKDFRDEISIFGLNNSDTGEINQTFLKLKKDSYSCNVITLGIAETIVIENHIKSLMPQCKFYGIDAVYNSRLIYNEIGRFYPIAVGDKQGYFKSNKIKEKSRVFYYLTLIEVLKSTDLQFVDYVLMNIDGSEYDVFNSMQFHEFQNNNVRICQINVVFYAPLKNYGITNENVKTMMEKVFKNSPYVPLVFVHDKNYRMLLVDLTNTECIEKYFLHCNFT